MNSTLKLLKSSSHEAYLLTNKTLFQQMAEISHTTTQYLSIEANLTEIQAVDQNNIDLLEEAAHQ
mgnify:CR=1 FL=1